jgi:hypothetical protein
MNANPTVVRVEDREYEGTCSMCGKESVRWIVVFDDGSQVGGECAKKILGWTPTAKKFSWVTGMTPVISGQDDCGQNIVVWKSKSGVRGVISVNGHPMTFGGFDSIMKDYQQRHAPYMNQEVAS